MQLHHPQPLYHATFRYDKMHVPLTAFRRSTAANPDCADIDLIKRRRLRRPMLLSSRLNYNMPVCGTSL